MANTATQRHPVCLEGLNDSGGDLDAFLAVSGGPSSIDLAAGITSPVYGILAADVPEDERGDVQIGGVAIFIAGAAGATEGARLMPEAGGTGKLVDWTVGAGANATIVGLCLKTAAANKQGEVLLGAGAMGQGA